MTFRILHVCVYNVCRSVFAERLTLLGVQRRGVVDVAVSSAGTAAKPEQPMHPLVDSILEAHGADRSAFVSRRLDRTLIESADLILTATAAERDAVLDLDPTALRRTFTLREFRRLAAQVGSGQTAGDVVMAAQQLRGRLPYVDPAELDVPDPAVTQSAFAGCARQVEQSVESILDVLCTEVQSCV